MTDIPIIFSAPMVVALLEGRKTMTRRLAEKPTRTALVHEGDPPLRLTVPSPWQRVKPGDRLWCRETWCRDGSEIFYRATHTRYEDDPDSGWRSPIHLARKDSRLTLIVTATKIEPVQAITEADAKSEGAYQRTDGMWTHDGENAAAGQNPIAYSFRMLWSVLHGNDGWESNPEVVALTFTVHKQNIDTLPSAAAA